MKEKKQLLIRIPETLYDELQRLAEDECRSLNGQIEYILISAIRNKRSQQKIVAEEVMTTLSESDISLSLTASSAYKIN